MKALPETMRQIGRDLVEKRLWPIAVLLLAVAVGAPMLIGRSAPDATAPVPVAATAPAVPAAAPSATTGEAGVRPKARGGKINDPFYDPPAPAAPAAASIAVAPAPAAGGGATSAGGGATSAGQPSPAGQTAPAPAPKSPATATPNGTTAAPKPSEPARTSVYYRAVVRWGSSLDAPVHAISRLTPLGGRDAPAAVYLGPTRADRLWAVFVLGPNTTSRGDGICKAGTGCRMIGLKAGDRQRVSVHGSDGRVVRRYWLRVHSLKTVRTTARAARAGRARVHPDGRVVLREMRRDPFTATVLGKARYDRDSGLLDATDPETDVEKAGE